MFVHFFHGVTSQFGALFAALMSRLLKEVSFHGVRCE
jgi:hypothetical protein